MKTRLTIPILKILIISATLITKTHQTKVAATTSLQTNYVKCTDYDCLKCSTPSTCEVCKNGFYLDSKTKECKVCGVGCISCYETGACHTCEKDYVLQGNGSCDLDSWGWVPWVLILLVIIAAIAGLYYLIRGHQRRRYQRGNKSYRNNAYYTRFNDSMNESQDLKYGGYRNSSWRGRSYRGGVPISRTNLRVGSPHKPIWDSSDSDSSDDHSYVSWWRKKKRSRRWAKNRKSKLLRMRRGGPRRKKKSYYDYMYELPEDFEYSPPRYFYTPERLKSRLNNRVTPYNPYLGMRPIQPNPRPTLGSNLFPPVSSYPVYHSAFVPPAIGNSVVKNGSLMPRISRFSAPSVL